MSGGATPKALARCPDWATLSIYPNIRLLVYNGPSQVGCISLAHGKHFVLGSVQSALADIPVEDPQGTVDEVHCSVTHHTAGRPFLTDLNSRHGTLLTPANVKRAVKIAPQRPVPLEEGSIINVGLSPTYFVLKGSVSTDPSVDEATLVASPEVYRHTVLNARKRTPEELQQLEAAALTAPRPRRPRKAVHWAAEIEHAEPTKHHAMAGSETRIEGMYGEVGRFAHLAYASRPSPAAGVGQFQNLVAESRIERFVKNVGQATKSPVFTFSTATRAAEATTSPTPSSPVTLGTPAVSPTQAEPAKEPVLEVPPRKRRRFPLPTPPPIPPPPPNASRRKHFFPPLVFKSRDVGM